MVKTGVLAFETIKMIFTYAQKRPGLSYFFGKRIVLDDAVHTEPLQL